jgi:hypothetical protein
VRRLAALTAGQQVLVALVAASVVGALGVVVPALGNAAMLVASAALLVALGVLAQWLWSTRHATDWSNTFTESQAPRGADSRVSSLARLVQAADRGDRDATAQVHALLGGLAAERLRDRRGLRLDADPEASRTALGPGLAAYLAQDPATPVTATQLDTLTSTLEEL